MTNEEAVENLNKVKDMFYFGGEMDIPDTLHTLNISIEALEENEKLKAEIEQLKAELKYATSITPKICETCEYEYEIAREEPCNSCVNLSNWKLKSKVEE